MTAQHQLIAYLATLCAIVALVAIGAVLAYNGRSVEAVGVAAAVTGLIGVIKLPASRPAVAETTSGDVNVTPSTKEN
jgi:hypothetical protein